MALTDAQKIGFLFKSYYQKSEVDTTKAFYEEPYAAAPFVLNSQIWNQSDQIPSTRDPGLADSNADGTTVGIVQLKKLKTFSAIGGVTNGFYLADLVDAIPNNFGDGTYAFKLYKNDGTTAIPLGTNDWVINTSGGTIIFYGGLPSGVSSVLPPKITFWKYVGTKGAGGGGGGSITVKDEGTTLTTTATSVDFVGANVTATNSGGDVTVTISGGTQGSTGFQGPSGGPQGSTGAQGTQGRQGTTGSQGSTGAQGTQGATGTQGNNGIQGTQGLDGAYAAIGIQGVQGVQGLTGAGTQGVQGRQGLQGVQGVQGIARRSGVLYRYNNSLSGGTPGSTYIAFNSSNPATVTIIYISITDAGGLINQSTWLANWEVNDNVSVNFPGFGTFVYKLTSVSGQFQYYQFSVTALSAGGSFGAFNDEVGVELYKEGSQGLQGLQGTQGRQGIQGQTGTQGPASGPQGMQGIQGTGNQGFQGITGNQGISGAFVSQGIQGSLGPQGRQGIQGFDGFGFQGVQGTVLSPGFYYEFDTVLTTSLSFGNFSYNSATLGSVTQLNLHQTTVNADTISNIISSLQVGTVIQISTRNYPTTLPTTLKTHLCTVNGSITLSGSVYQIPITITNSGSETNFALNDSVSITFIRVGGQGTTGSQGGQGIQGVIGLQGPAAGPQGTQGTTGTQGSTGTQGIQGLQGRQGIQGAYGATAGVPYTMSGTITSGDPGTGLIRYNNSLAASTTAIYIDQLDASTGNNNQSSWINSWDDAGQLAGSGFLTITNVGATGSILSINIFKVLSVADNSGWHTVNVTFVSGTNTPIGGNSLIIQFSSAGTQGATGTQGTTGTSVQGTQGTSGTVQGIQGIQGPSGAGGGGAVTNSLAIAYAIGLS